MKLKMTGDTYKSWKEFMYAILTENNQFRIENSFTKSETDIEIYRQYTGDKDTTLQIGYLEDDRLIYLHINNTQTPGLNKYQVEYYSEHDFEETESHGNPGLFFNETNRIGVLDELKNGLKGKEKVFFREGIPVFSELSIVLDQKQNINFKDTYNFENLSSWTRLLRLFKKQQVHYETKEIDLKTVFAGLKE